MRSRSLFLAIALVLVVAPPSARAETSPAPVTQPAPSCGSTADEKLAAARKALQSNDAAMRAALACLIEATGTLNNQVQNIKAGRNASGALNVPSAVTPCNWAGANGCR